MARLRFRGRRQQRSGMLLLVALGAVTGMALGVVLAERVGGIDGLRERAKGAQRGKRRAPDLAVDEASLEPTDAPHAPSFDADADDDYPIELGAHDQAPPEEAELEARVLEVFRNDPTLRGRAIDIGAIGGGTIELTGWVLSDAELTHALTLARGVPDVADVMDSLTVRGTQAARVGQSRTDR